MIRKDLAVAVVVTLLGISGAGIVFLAQRIDFALLLLLVAALPTWLYALQVLLLADLKFRRLFKQLRWWHLLWLMAFVSGLTFRIRGVEDIQENPLDPAAIYRVALIGTVGLILVGAFSLRQRAGIDNLFRGLIGWLTAYAVVCVLSTFWSVYPAWTLYKSVEYLITVALIAAVVGSVRTTREFKALFDWTWLLIGLVLVSVWLGLIYSPEEARLRGVGLLGTQLQGVFPRVAANSVGELGALIGIVSFVRFLYGKGSSRRFYLSVFAIAIVTLVLSQSRSPLTGFLLAIPLILFLDGRISLLLVALTIPLVLSFTPLGDTFWEFFRRGQTEELFLSFTGRVYWWQAALPMVKENLLLGHGAYAAGRFLVAKEFDATLSSLHSTWVEVFIGAGIVGLLLLLAAVVGTWLVLLRASRSRLCAMDPLWQQLRLEAVGVMTLLSVRSVFANPFIWHPALNWLLVLGYAEFLQRRHTNRIHPQSPPTAHR